jgi:hypothetical protein
VMGRPVWRVGSGLRATLMSCALTACSSGAMETVAYGPPPPRAAAELIPERAQVGGGSVSVGVALGHIRDARSVASFAITKNPVTAEQYRQCMAAGACTEPKATTFLCRTGQHGIDRPTLVGDAIEGAPVTCVDETNARAYCAWVGGRLPTVDEWLLAARGSDVRRWAWGDDTPTCDRNWRTSFDTTDNLSCCGKDCGASDVIAASLAAGLPHGEHMDRVLATYGELVLPSARGRTLGCVANASSCYVNGMLPGAIDFIFRKEDFDKVASFRCAWGGQS